MKIQNFNKHPPPPPPPPPKKKKKKKKEATEVPLKNIFLCIVCIWIFTDNIAIFHILTVMAESMTL